MACRVQLEGKFGRRFCMWPGCRNCYPASSETQEYCPTHQAMSLREGQERRRKAKRTGGKAGTLFAVHYDGLTWWLPLDEVAATIQLGNFPADVPVEFCGRVGRVVQAGDRWKWRAAR